MVTVVGPGGIPSEWTDVSLSQSEWLIRKYCAFEIDRRELGLFSKRTDQPPRDVDPPQPCQNLSYEDAINVIESGTTISKEERSAGAGR